MLTDAASILYGSIAVLALLFTLLTLARRRRETPDRLESPVGPETGYPIMWFRHGGEVEISDAARRLLSISAHTVSAPGALFAELRRGREKFEAKIEELRREGVGFSAVIETREGRIIEATGAPYGVDIGVTFHDQTELRRRIADMEARVEFLQQDLETARALDRAGKVCAFRTDAAGEVVWENADFARLSPAGRRRLMEVSQRDARVVLKDGEEERVFLTRTAVTDDGGRVSLCFRADEIEYAESALQSLVDTMSETFAHLNIGMMLFDGDLKLALFNPAMAELLREDMDFLKGAPDLRRLLDRMRRARNLPEQIDFSEWRDRIIALGRSDDDEKLEEVWHLPDGRSQMVRFRTHTAGGMALIIEDVTEEIALRRDHASEQAMRSASNDVLEEGLAIFGPDGLLRMANGAMRRIWGLEESWLYAGAHVGHVVKLCAPMTEAPEFWRGLQNAATHNAARLEKSERIRLLDGRCLRARISPLPDGSLLTVFTDVTASENFNVALRERNEALEHADEMRSALIDQISHQMRTPLNSICGFGRLLQDERLGDLSEAQRDYVSCIVDSSSELLEAIDSMADLISVGADAYFDGDESFAPDLALRDVADLARRRLGDEAPRLRIEAVKAAEFVGRRARVRQIMFNMMMDAMAHTAPEEEVLFSLDSCDGSLTMTCSHPVAPNHQEQGLALALVRRFALLCGGNVDVVVDIDGERRVTCRMIGEAAERAGDASRAALTASRH